MMQLFFGLTPELVLLLLIVGAAVGFVSAFFGVGGCFLMVPVMIVVFTDVMGVDVGVATKLAFGTNMGVVVPTALSGAYRHYREAGFPWTHYWRFAIPVGIGSVLGSIAAFFAPGYLLKVLFGIMCIIGAYRFMTARPKPVDALPDPDPKKFGAAGTSAGALAHFMGIGGGLVYVPVLNTVLSVPARAAVAISVATMVIGSGVGAISFALLGSLAPGGTLPPGSIGWFSIPLFLLLATSSVVFAQLGGKATHRISPKRLKVLMAVLYVYIGLRLVGILALLGWPY